MKLTKAQIDMARSDGVATLFAQAQPVSAKTVDELAAAYERVAALLARYETDPGRGSAAWDECVRPWVDELRRALEG